MARLPLVTHRAELDVDEMRDLLQMFVDAQHGGHLGDAAQALQLSYSQLHRLLHGKRPISDAVARKFGYRRNLIYERI